MAISPMMMGLTWVTFILVTIILYKVAWKPILAALESARRPSARRRKTPRQIREELQKMEEKPQKIHGRGG